MGWKTKRLIGTAMFSMLPYLAWSFIAFDWWSAFASADNRFLWLILTVCFGTASYTYPFWKDEA